MMRNDSRHLTWWVRIPSKRVIRSMFVMRRRLIRGGYISIRISISRVFGRMFGSFILGVIRFARSGLRIGGEENFLMIISDITKG